MVDFIRLLSRWVNYRRPDFKERKEMSKCFFCKNVAKRLHKADNGKSVCNKCREGCKWGYHIRGTSVDPTGLVSNACDICGHADSWFRL